MPTQRNRARLQISVAALRDPKFGSVQDQMRLASMGSKTNVNLASPSPALPLGVLDHVK